MTMQLDETLLDPRKIVSRTPDLEFDGAWSCVLECGHQIWFAIEPHMDEIICAECLDKLIDQHRELKARQTRPTTL